MDTMKKFVTTVILLVSFSFGQKLDFKFDKITTKDGLNQNTVTTILQSRQGYLWFGTPNGLTRYDGYSFITYKNLNDLKDLGNSSKITAVSEDQNANLWIGTANDGLFILNGLNRKFQCIEEYSETTGSITNIYTDSQNNIWVATEKDGLKKYNSNFKLLEHYKHSKHENSISSDNIAAILEDSNNNLWVGTRNGGLNMVNPTSKNVSVVELNIPGITITSLNIDRYGILWIGSKENGLILFDTNSGLITTYKHNPDNKTSLVHNQVHFIFRDSQYRFWIGTENGLSLIDADEGYFHNFYRNPTDPLSLSGNQVLSIFEDKSGIMWIGTNRNGLNRVNRSFADFNNYFQDPQDKNSLPSDLIWNIKEGQFGNIWIGTDKGLTFWDRNRNRFNTYSVQQHSLNNEVIRSVEEFDEDMLIIGTDGGGINIFDIKNGRCGYYTNSTNPKSISNNQIRDILKNDDGTFWIATMGGLNHFDPQSELFTRYVHQPGDNMSLSDNRILHIEKDNDGNIWLATYHGLSVFNPQTGKFKNYFNDPGDNYSLSHDECNTLFISGKDQDFIWVGTENGLNKLDKKTGKAIRYTQQDHENNVLYSILEDEEGYLWLGTKRGISRFNKSNGTFKNFDQNDGIRNYEYNAGASLKLSDGSLFMGGLSGITGFKPSEMKRNDIIPNIVITSFKKFGESFPVDSVLATNGTLNLSFEDKFISFEFAAMDFTNSAKNQYKYMLEGFDETWINSGYRRSASYTNLSGGNYTFLVIGSNNDGVWNENGARLKIYVAPAFWATWWFQLLLFSSVFSLVYAIYRNRTDFMKRQRHELQKEVSVQTRELYKSNLNLQDIMAQNASILENVEEGFFILDKDLIIQSQFSRALLDILEIESPAGLKLLKVLDNYLPDKDLSLIRDYLGFIFDHQLDEELIKDLNPLKRLEFNFNTGGKQFSKFLTFRFKRIRLQNQIKSLIVTVIDDTKEFKLSLQLEQNEEKSKAQVEMLMGILHLDAEMLNEFMSSTYVEISKIEALLQSGHKQDEYKKVLKKLIASITLLKENAVNLDLKFFLHDVMEIEAKTGAIREKEHLTGMDFLPLVLQLKEMKNHLDELNNLVDRISKFSAKKNNQPLVLDEHVNN
jgi:ligand-binding sensor domain-containing protein